MREYIAEVVNDTPDRYNRSQVRVYEKFADIINDKDLPYAEYRLPVGARFNEGGFVPARKGDRVWVDFPFSDDNGDEDTTRPRITGSVHFCPDGLPNMPHDAFGGVSGLDG